MIKQKILVSALIAGGLLSPLAYATDGYFATGYGVKAVGMGGVGIALPQDALAAATNPAGMVVVGDRIDFGVEYFVPKRSAQLVGNAFNPTNPTFDGNGMGKDSFLIPNFGYNKMISSDTSLGIAIYGNGGMNASYTTPINLFGNGTFNASMDMAQLFIAPTWSMKLNPTNEVGVSLNLAYQTFALTGAENFAPASSAPTRLTDNGHDHSTGYGLRLGWLGQVTDNVTLGATYQTKTKMSKFNNYSGLFANGGEFDIPANYGIGVAVKTSPTLTVAADIERIEFAGVSSVGNPMSLPPPLFGSPGAAGFGWKNQTVFKLGVSYKYQPNLTLRAGINHGTATIPSTQTLFNIFAPATVQDNLALGATWTLADKSEISVAYSHGFKKTINGTNSIPPGLPPGGFGGGNANLSLYEDTLAISYGW